MFASRECASSTCSRIRATRGNYTGDKRQDPISEVINLVAKQQQRGGYDNHPLTKVNDHEIRISSMTEAYHWHRHPDSDESFLVLEGGVFIDSDDHTVELLAGHTITVNRGFRHRTRPIGERSVNLTLERAGARTEPLVHHAEGSSGLDEDRPRF